MKTTLTSVLFAAVSFMCGAQQLRSSDEGEIVFEDVHVLPMTNDKVLEHQTVVTRDGKITDIGPVKKTRYGKNAYVIDARGKYLMPGLAEMHAHVPPTDDINAMKEVLKLFAVNGITTIRGMLGHPKHLQLRDSIRSGKIIGPHFYTTGPSFNGMSVRSPEEGADMVRKQKALGYDYLKLHPGLTRAEFDAIASTAKEVGIPFAGHVSFGVGVWRAIEAGYSSIDHLDGFIEGLVPEIKTINEQQAGTFGMHLAGRVDRSRIPELMKALKANNVWVVPTQSLAERWFNPGYTIADFNNDPHRKYIKPETAQQWIGSKKNLLANPAYDEAALHEFVKLRRELILECEKNGVGLLLGCDAPQIFNVPGFSTHNELEYLVVSGLTPYQALKTGTVNVAKYLGQTDGGVIKEGAASDLILLNANPLTDINNSRKIEGVMIGDQWMDKHYVEAELKKLEH